MPPGDAREDGSIILIGRQSARPEQGVRHLLREQNGDPQPHAELYAGPQEAGNRVNVLSLGEAFSSCEKISLSD
jgi:hypothetical protein